MALINTTPEEVQLFTADDPYFFTVDNRPLLKLIENDININEQLMQVAEGDCEVIQFIFETPSVENSAGGIFPSFEGGSIVRVALSVGTPGSSGSFEVDVKINGTTIYTSSANRPVLAYNDSDKTTLSVAPNIEVTAVPPEGRITTDIIQIQSGTPRWFRVTVWIRKPHTGASE